MAFYAYNRGYAILEKMTGTCENIICQHSLGPGPTKASWADQAGSTVISLGNRASLYSTAYTNSACAGSGSMYQIFPILVVLYVHMFVQVVTYRQWAA